MPPPPNADYTFTMSSIPSTSAAEPVDAVVQVDVVTGILFYLFILFVYFLSDRI